MWREASKKLYGCISPSKPALSRYGGVGGTVVSDSVSDEEWEEKQGEPAKARRAERLARTLLTGLREEEEEEVLAKLDRLPELLAIDSLDGWRGPSGVRIELDLVVNCLWAGGSMGVCSCSMMVERLSEEERKDELWQVGLSVGEQMGQSLSWL